jgi:hypothetical protein
MKWNLKNKLMQTGMAAIVLTMAVGGIGGASAADEKAQEKSPLSVLTVASTPGVAAVSTGTLLSPVHEREYWKLLVAAYAPDASAAWKKALEERKQAEAALPKVTAISKVVIDKEGTEGSSQRIEGLPDAPKDTPEPSKEKLRSMEGVSAKAGEGAETKNLATKPHTLEEGDGIINKELPAEFKRQQQLGEALEKGDAQAIRGLLPQLLEDYKKQTESIRTLADKLKEAKQLDSPAAKPTK